MKPQHNAIECIEKLHNLSWVDYNKIRRLVQGLETALDSLDQKIKNPKIHWSHGKIRSLQTNYFPQIDYSLHNKAYGDKTKVHPSRQNYHKYKKEKELESMMKLQNVAGISVG